MTCLLLQPPFKLPRSPKPNLTAILCLTAKLFDIPLAWTQRATPRRSSLPACTVDSTHPIACKICLGNLEPRNIPPNRSCCNTAHPLIPTILARQASISKQAHTRTHTHTHADRQRNKQRPPQPTACETTIRNAVGLTTRCHLTTNDRGEQLIPSCHPDQKVERQCPS